MNDVNEILIIVDMVNGFVRDGAMADKYIEHIIPEQIKLINNLDDMKQLIFIKEAHEEDSIEFKRYPKHCIKGTFEAELVDELKSFENNAKVFEKNSTCAIFNKDLLTYINEFINLKKVTVVGCCTDICVMNLAIPLKNYFDEFNKDIDVIVVKDATETYDSDVHNRELYNDMAYEIMKQAGIKVVD